MAYEWDVDRERRRGVIRVRGVVTGREIRLAIEALMHDERWEADFDVLWDGRDTTGLEVDPREMDAIAETGRRFIRRAGAGRTALLIARDLDRALARLYMLLAPGKGRERRIFRTLEEAEAWLERRPS